MKLSPEEVRRVAHLARIELAEEEVEQLAGQLSAVLAWAGALERVDVSGVEPTAHAIPVTNVLRPDRVRPSLPREAALQNAPDTESGYIRVPRIVGEEG